MTDIPCVGAVVFDDAGRLLLIKRGQAPALGLWSIPGGRIEAGESAEDAVVREVLEETGVAVTVLREVGTVHRDLPGGDRYVIRDFLARPDDLTGLRAGDDAADVALVPPSELGERALSPGLIEALTGWGLL